VRGGFRVPAVNRASDPLGTGTREPFTGITRAGARQLYPVKRRDAAEAAEARAVLCEPSCGPKCEGNHLVVYGDGVTLRVLRGLRPFRSVVPDLFV
jgi:hypothetical protein